MTGFPVIAREALASAVAGDRQSFPFHSWAAANGFAFPAPASRFLAHSASAAEAYFLRAIVGHACLVFDERDGAIYRTLAGTQAIVTPQLPCHQYRIDVGVITTAINLAVEVDGVGFHHRTSEQLASDCLRACRLTLAGYTVIRFTAREAFNDPAECWRQIDAILDARASELGRTTAEKPRSNPATVSVP